MARLWRPDVHVNTYARLPLTRCFAPSVTTATEYHLGLLKAKLANLAEIKPPRPQDAHHVRLLCLLTAEYLKEQHAQVAGKRLAERILINALNELHRLNTTPSARRLEKQFGLPLGLALPLDLSAASLPKLAAFYRHLTPP